MKNIIHSMKKLLAVFLVLCIVAPTACSVVLAEESVSPEEVLICDEPSYDASTEDASSDIYPEDEAYDEVPSYDGDYTEDDYFYGEDFDDDGYYESGVYEDELEDEYWNEVEYIDDEIALPVDAYGMICNLDLALRSDAYNAAGIVVNSNGQDLYDGDVISSGLDFIFNCPVQDPLPSVQEAWAGEEYYSLTDVIGFYEKPQNGSSGDYLVTGFRSGSRYIASLDGSAIEDCVSDDACTVYQGQLSQYRWLLLLSKGYDSYGNEITEPVYTRLEISDFPADDVYQQEYYDETVQESTLIWSDCECDPQEGLFLTADDTDVHTLSFIASPGWRIEQPDWVYIESETYNDTVLLYVRAETNSGSARSGWIDIYAENGENIYTSISQDSAAYAESENTQETYAPEEQFTEETHLSSLQAAEEGYISGEQYDEALDYTAEETEIIAVELPDFQIEAPVLSWTDDVYGLTNGLYSEASGGQGSTRGVNSNTDWQVTTPEWVMAEPSSGSGNGVFTVYIDENTGADREGYIQVSADGCESISMYILQAGPQNDETAGASGIIQWNGHTYQLIDEAMTWQQAKAYCESLGGYLVTITSAQEQSAIESLLAAGGSKNVYWIGLEEEGGNGVWVTGEACEYSNWQSGEPSSSGERYGEIYFADSSYGDPYKWNDSSNDGNGSSFHSTSNHGFICEFGTVEENTVPYYSIPVASGPDSVFEGEEAVYTVYAENAVGYIAYINGKPGGEFEALGSETDIPLTFESAGKFMLQFAAIYSDGIESEQSEKIIVTVAEKPAASYGAPEWHTESVELESAENNVDTNYYVDAEARFVRLDYESYDINSEIFDQGEMGVFPVTESLFSPVMRTTNYKYIYVISAYGFTGFTDPVCKLYLTVCDQSGNDLSPRSEALTVCRTDLLQNEAQDSLIASGECGDNATWTLDTDGTFIVSGIGPMWDYTYSFWDTFHGSDTQWEEYMDLIKKVVIENGITCVGHGSFAYCKNLEELEIAQSVKKIKGGAFENTSIRSLILPEGLEEIDYYAFLDITTLKHVELPDTLIKIGYGSFWGCSLLREIDIPQRVDYIAEDAFSDNLQIIRFHGNAPSVCGDSDGWAFPESTVVFYQEGRSGWSTPEWTSSSGHTYEAYPFSRSGEVEDNPPESPLPEAPLPEATLPGEDLSVPTIENLNISHNPVTMGEELYMSGSVEANGGTLRGVRVSVFYNDALTDGKVYRDYAVNDTSFDLSEVGAIIPGETLAQDGEVLIPVAGDYRIGIFATNTNGNGQGDSPALLWFTVKNEDLKIDQNINTDTGEDAPRITRFAIKKTELDAQEDAEFIFQLENANYLEFHADVNGVMLPIQTIGTAITRGSFRWSYAFNTAGERQVAFIPIYKPFSDSDPVYGEPVYGKIHVNGSLEVTQGVYNLDPANRTGRVVANAQYGGAGNGIHVSANVDWNVRVESGSSWISAWRDGNVVRSSYQPNTYGAPREGRIVISAQGCPDWVITASQDVIPLQWTASMKSGSVSDLQYKLTQGFMNPNCSYWMRIYSGNTCVGEKQITRASGTFHTYNHFKLTRNQSYSVRIEDSMGNVYQAGSIRVPLYQAVNYVHSGIADVTTSKTINSGDPIEFKWDGSYGVYQTYVRVTVNGKTVFDKCYGNSDGPETETIAAAAYQKYLSQTGDTAIKIYVQPGKTAFDSSLRATWEGKIKKAAEEKTNTSGYEIAVVYNNKEIKCDSYSFTPSGNSVYFGLRAYHNGKMLETTGKNAKYRFVIPFGNIDDYMCPYDFTINPKTDYFTGHHKDYWLIQKCDAYTFRYNPNVFEKCLIDLVDDKNNTLETIQIYVRRDGRYVAGSEVGYEAGSHMYNQEVFLDSTAAKFWDDKSTKIEEKRLWFDLQIQSTYNRIMGAIPTHNLEAFTEEMNKDWGFQFSTGLNAVMSGLLNSVSWAANSLIRASFAEYMNAFEVHNGISKAIVQKLSGKDVTAIEEMLEAITSNYESWYSETSKTLGALENMTDKEYSLAQSVIEYLTSTIPDDMQEIRFDVSDATKKFTFGKKVTDNLNKAIGLLIKGYCANLDKQLLLKNVSIRDNYLSEYALDFEQLIKDLKVTKIRFNSAKGYDPECYGELQEFIDVEASRPAIQKAVDQWIANNLEGSDFSNTGDVELSEGLTYTSKTHWLMMDEDLGGNRIYEKLKALSQSSKVKNAAKYGGEIVSAALGILKVLDTVQKYEKILIVWEEQLTAQRNKFPVASEEYKFYDRIMNELLQGIETEATNIIFAAILPFLNGELGLKDLPTYVMELLGVSLSLPVQLAKLGLVLAVADNSSSKGKVYDFNTLFDAYINVQGEFVSAIEEFKASPSHENFDAVEAWFAYYQLLRASSIGMMEAMVKADATRWSDTIVLSVIDGASYVTNPSRVAFAFLKWIGTGDTSGFSLAANRIEEKKAQELSVAEAKEQDMEALLYLEGYMFPFGDAYTWVIEENS